MPEISKNKILAGRNVVEAYREAHAALHSKRWHKGVPEEHTPLLNIMLKALNGLGFNTIEDFVDADEEYCKIEVVDYLRTASICSLEVEISDPYEFVATFEALEPNSLFFGLSPRFIYLGRDAYVADNVNLGYCAEKSIPVVRGIHLGRGYSYDSGDALWVCLTTDREVPESVFREVLKQALTSVGFEVFVRGNDLRIGDCRVGMTAPSVKVDRQYSVLAEILLHSNTIEMARRLKFPEDKWKGKPVSNIHDWILPLNKIREILLDELVVAVEQALYVVGRRELRTTELDAITKLGLKYQDESWRLKY